jgi:hypothetical protein
MKMKPGPKAILYFVAALGLIAFGFWVGRGMPRTWDAVIHPTSAAYAQQTAVPAVSPQRVDALEARIDVLEQQVDMLRNELNAARTATPTPEPRQPQSVPPVTVQPQGSTQTPDQSNPEFDASVHIR